MLDRRAAHKERLKELDMDIKPKPPVTPLVIVPRCASPRRAESLNTRKKPKYTPPAHLMVRPFEGLSALLQTR